VESRGGRVKIKTAAKALTAVNKLRLGAKKKKKQSEEAEFDEVKQIDGDS